MAPSCLIGRPDRGGSVPSEVDAIGFHLARCLQFDESSAAEVEGSDDDEWDESVVALVAPSVVGRKRSVDVGC